MLPIGCIQSISLKRSRWLPRFYRGLIGEIINKEPYILLFYILSKAAIYRKPALSMKLVKVNVINDKQ